MSVFKAAIVPRLETQPVISAMTNASRNAITSFSIEMRSIQVGIAPWRVIGTKRQNEWYERSLRQQSVSIKLSLKSDTAT